MAKRQTKAIQLFFKQVFDYLCSLLGLLVISPLLLIIALLIKLDSKGPVFFRQERLGLNGKVFRIFKFRTMIVNAENMGDGLRVKTGSDSRITKLGKFLRSTSLDELPQLFNVLLGEMSLVGPRPPATYFPYDGYRNYPEEAQKRFNMKPGLTGLAQVTVRTSVPWDKRIEFDLQYIETFSILLDLKILWKTVLKLFKAENIYSDESNVRGQ